MNNFEKKSIAFYTFATVDNDFGHKSYESEVENLKLNLRQYGHQLFVISHLDIWESLSEVQKRMFKLRKGAGYWTWKAAAINFSLATSKSDITVYVDADMQFLIPPMNWIPQHISDYCLVVFRQNNNISDFISKNCANFFGNSRAEDSKLVSASCFVMRTDSQDLRLFVSQWNSNLENHRILIDPILDFSRRHRHDQSILSCMLPKSSLKFKTIDHGFYSMGSEKTSIDFDNALVLHGRLSSDSKSIIKRIKFQLSFFRHKMQYFIWCIQFSIIRPGL